MIVRLKRLLGCLALTAGLLLSGALALHTQAAAAGQLVVGVAPGFDEAQLHGLLVRHGAVLERWLPALGLALVRVSAGAEQRTAEALSADPAVDFATENRRSVRAADIPLDQYFPQQWGMVKVQGPEAWDVGWAHPNLVVAIVDTGVNYLHQDLRDRTWYNPGEADINPATGLRDCTQPISFNGLDDDGNGYVDDCRGWNFYNQNRNPLDGHGHGTAVAGIVAATTNNYDPVIQGYAGVAGMARQARLMELRSLGDDGTGYPFDVASAISYAAENGAQVINLSLQLDVANPNPYDVEILRRAVESAQAAGVLLVGVSGNDAYRGIAYPGAFPGVLAVGASTPTDGRAYFSNYGDRLDLVAPGVSIISTLRQPGNQSYGYFRDSGSGTSFAAPHVAGVAALVRSLRPDLDGAAVYELIRSSADDVGPAGFDRETGWGRLNAYRAAISATVGLTLGLAADPPTVAAGNQTLVRLQVTAPGAVAAGLGGRVVLTAALGAITPTVVTLDGLGQASAFFTADVLTGTAEVTATLGAVSATLPITITSGIPAALELSASPQVISNGGGQAVITATVRDEGGSSVPDGTEVTFSTTLGSVMPVTATTTGGRAATVLTSGLLTGTAVVQAQVAGITATVPVEIAGAGEPFTLTLSASPTEILVAGSPAAITATIVDVQGQRVPNGTPVHFAADLGLLSVTDTATLNGEAGTLLYAGTMPGPARVTATAGSVSGDVVVTILPGQAFTLTLTATPGELVAGYGQIARLRARASDRYGNPVADGTLLSFASSLGLVTPASISTVGGIGEADFVGELVAGTAAITVTAPGGATGHTQVRIRPAPPSSLSLAITPEQITVGDQAARLTARLWDAYGNRVEDGTVVRFDSDLGTLRLPTFASLDLGKGQDPVSALPVVIASSTVTATTTDGAAVAELVAGPTVGTAHVRAGVGQDLVSTGVVTITAGPPATVYLAVLPDRVPIFGRAQLQAAVLDAYGNAVADGTPVRFIASRGRLDRSEAPTQGGVATTWITADSGQGTISLAVISGGASAFGTLSVDPGRTFLPLILR